MEILNKIAAPIIVILFFFIVLFGYTKLAGPIPFDITQVTTSKTDAFTVTGEGKVNAMPDSATVRIGVVAKAATSEKAQEILNSDINKVIESIKALGVKDEDIKTENYNIYPEYNDVLMVPSERETTANQNNISGYNANTNITVTVATAELANKVLSAGTASGANQVGGVDFQVKDKEKAMNQARELAVADAKKKAEDAARIAGFKLGKVINYSESEGGGGWPYPLMAKSEDAEISSTPTRIQPGTNEIVVNVTLSYEIR